MAYVGQLCASEDCSFTYMLACPTCPNCQTQNPEYKKKKMTEDFVNIRISHWHLHIGRDYKHFFAIKKNSFIEMKRVEGYTKIYPFFKINTLRLPRIRIE